MRLFDQLIAPRSKISFFEEFWTKKELHFKSDYDLSSLFSLEELNQIILVHKEHLGFPVIRLVKNGKVIPETKFTELVTKKREGTSRQIAAGKLLALCDQGATLSFNGLNNYSDKLFAFCAQLSEEIGERTQVNGYVSQKGNKGFDAHFDHHEIFILQLKGEKHWTFYGKATDFPLATDLYYDQGEPDHTDQRNYVLTPGDILYIPRGMWHEARAVNTSSFHLTLNINCKTKLDFFNWLLSRASSENSLLRENMPLPGLPEDHNFIDKVMDYLRNFESSEKELIDRFRTENYSGCDIKIPFKS